MASHSRTYGGYQDACNGCSGLANSFVGFVCPPSLTASLHVSVWRGMAKPVKWSHGLWCMQPTYPAAYQPAYVIACKL